MKKNQVIRNNATGEMNVDHAGQRRGERRCKNVFIMVSYRSKRMPTDLLNRLYGDYSSQNELRGS
jgi:hypothetical protein